MPAGQAGLNRLRPRGAPCDLSTQTAVTGGPATSARVSGPQRVAVDGAGDLLIADTGSDRIRAGPG